MIILDLLNGLPKGLTVKTIETAKRLFAATLWERDPLLNVTLDHEIVLEWWNKKKKLTIYVCEDTIDYIKVWGPDMVSEMADGTLHLDDGEVVDLWDWLDGDYYLKDPPLIKVCGP